MTDLDSKQQQAYWPTGKVDCPGLMRQALQEAALAADLGEVPVGAVVADASGAILAAAGNRNIAQSDPSAHAEILAIRQAAQKAGNYRLQGTILISTLEPCIMCLGCLVQARCSGLIFACRDSKAGAVVSRLQVGKDLDWLNHEFWYTEGLLQDECSALLRDFFRIRRRK
ncbi:MAG: nucleoside deaminase [Thermodesulfobacteriota bacterium]